MPNNGSGICAVRHSKSFNQSTALTWRMPSSQIKMTIEKFIQETFKEEHGCCKRPRIVCNDGFNMSVQGSAKHYCNPRKTQDWYNSLEIGYPSDEESLINQYAEIENDWTGAVYGYVPIGTIQEVITKHGGINIEETFNLNKIKMEDRKIRQLTKDELFIFLTFERNKSNVDELFNQIRDSGGWVLTAIEKHFEAHELGVDKKVMIAVMSLGDGVIGKCVKYVADIAEWCDKNNQTKVDWDIFTKRIYPHGVPIF